MTHKNDDSSKSSLLYSSLPVQYIIIIIIALGTQFPRAKKLWQIQIVKVYLCLHWSVIIITIIIIIIIIIINDTYISHFCKAYVIA